MKCQLTASGSAMTRRGAFWSSAAVFLLASALFAGIQDYAIWQHWIATHTGSYNTPGTPPGYNYWSAFGSVFPWSMGLIAAVLQHSYLIARKNNCHTHGCWRVGSLPVGDYRVCRKHHLEVTGKHPTISHLRAHHQLHIRAKLKTADVKWDCKSSDGRSVF